MKGDLTKSGSYSKTVILPYIWEYFCFTCVRRAGVGLIILGGIIERKTAPWGDAVSASGAGYFCMILAM